MASTAAPKAANVAAAAPALRFCGGPNVTSRLAADLAKGFFAKSGATVGFVTGSADQTFAHLANGTCQVAIIGRQMPAAQLHSSKIPLAENVVALDGVVIIVNPANNVASFDFNSAAQIFSGRTSNWSAVGGPNQPIEVVVPEAASDETAIFRSNVLNGGGIAGNAKIAGSLSNVATTVGHDRNAIGFVGFNASDPGRVVPLTQNGHTIAASSLSIAQKRYPLMMPFYMYGPLHDTHSLAAQFVNFALSDAGQTIVENAGFVGRNSV